MKLLITRHPQCLFNEQGKYQGIRDSSFTSRGETQLALLAGRLKTEKVEQIVTDTRLVRLNLAANHLANSLGAIIISCPEFAEANYGQWEGLTKAQAQEFDPAAWARYSANDLDPEFTFPQGENIGKIKRRLRQGLENIDFSYPTLIVGSNMSGRLLFQILTGLKPVKRIQQCSLTILQKENNHSLWIPQLVCDESHLDIQIAVAA